MTTEALAGFQTPEEAALDLELPLLGTLPSPTDASGPIAPRVPPDERARREYHRAADRILLSPLSRSGAVGLVGDVSSLRRARIAADLAAALSAEKTSILVDADLTGAHLSFDERGRAQEGLVDVLRYGVRSPRVVAPTQAPGLNLLPVGSGTVDLASTYGSEATPALFAELRRTGDLVIVNGPDVADLAAAAGFVAEVGAWILVHEFGASDPRRTRGLKEALGHAACVGVLAIVADRPRAEAALRGAGAGRAAGRAAAEASWGRPDDAHHEAFRPTAAPVPPAPPPVWEEAPAESAADDLAAHEPEIEFPEPREESVGGAFEPIRAVPPERDAPIGWRGARDLHDLRGTDPGSLVEPDEGGRGRGVATKILVGMLIAGALGVGGFLWLGGGNDTPPSPPPPVGRASGGPPPAPPVVHPTEEKPTAETPVASGPAVEKPVLQKPAPAKPAVEPPGPAKSAAAKPARPSGAGLPEVTPEGAWGVHVSSVLTEAGARQEVEALKKAGWSALSRHVLVPDKGWWFRVYAGPYATKEDAKLVAAEIKKTRVRDWAVAQKIPDEGTGQGDR